MSVWWRSGPPVTGKRLQSFWCEDVLKSSWVSSVCWGCSAWIISQNSTRSHFIFSEKRLCSFWNRLQLSGRTSGGFEMLESEFLHWSKPLYLEVKLKVSAPEMMLIINRELDFSEYRRSALKQKVLMLTDQYKVTVADWTDGPNCTDKTWDLRTRGETQSLSFKGLNSAGIPVCLKWTKLLITWRLQINTEMNKRLNKWINTPLMRQN